MIPKKMVLLLIATTLVCAPFAGSVFANPARDDVLRLEKDAGHMIVDTFILRPAGICGQPSVAAQLAATYIWGIMVPLCIDLRLATHRNARSSRPEALGGVLPCHSATRRLHSICGIA